jgi:hypothetical protein
MKKPAIVSKNNLVTGHKTDWPTDRRSQHNLNFNFNFLRIS